MSNLKISQLPVITTIAQGDLLPVVDSGVTSAVTFANLIASIATRNVREEAVSGSGTAFTLAHTPIANTLALFRGGARITVAAGDYTISGASITLSTALESGNTLTADYTY